MAAEGEVAGMQQFLAATGVFPTARDLVLKIRLEKPAKNECFEVFGVAHLSFERTLVKPP